MTAAAALALIATALVVWPPDDARRRALRLGDSTPNRVRAFGFRGGWAVAAVPAVGAALGPAAAVAAGIVAALLLWRMRRIRAAAARECSFDDLRQALVVMVAELRVGAPAVGACRSAVEELERSGRDSEVMRALGRLAAQAELGGMLTAAPDDPPGVSRLVEAWSMSSDAGLPLADLLAALRADLVARQDFVERTGAGLAGPRATSTVLAGLPLLGIALGQAMGARPLAVLLGPGAGGALLVVGVGLAAVGVVWSESIVSRVLR
ncbi:MAG: hypothetical protein QM658_06345 [Gordonia sp. (in: high G+C Gram-positive bacteria)]